MDVHSKGYDPKSLFDLSGKTAFVTGASMGLGYRFAWTLAKAGAKVVVTARTKSKLEKLGEAINDLVDYALLNLSICEIEVPSGNV